VRQKRLPEDAWISRRGTRWECGRYANLQTGRAPCSGDTNWCNWPSQNHADGQSAGYMRERVNWGYVNEASGSDGDPDRVVPKRRGGWGAKGGFCGSGGGKGEGCFLCVCGAGWGRNGDGERVRVRERFKDGGERKEWRSVGR
jgi:hypothetical protein